MSSKKSVSSQKGPFLGPLKPKKWLKNVYVWGANVSTKTTRPVCFSNLIKTWLLEQNRWISFYLIKYVTHKFKKFLICTSI